MSILEALENVRAQRAKLRAAHSEAIGAMANERCAREQSQAAREAAKEQHEAYRRAVRALGHEIDVEQGAPEFKGSEFDIP